MFNDPDAQSPFARRDSFGFRCVRYVKDVSRAAGDPIEWAKRDYRQERPVPDRVFRIYRSLYAYDRTPLNSSDIPRTELIREVLDWLDRYLGPVRTK